MKALDFVRLIGNEIHVARYETYENPPVETLSGVVVSVADERRNDGDENVVITFDDNSSLTIEPFNWGMYSFQIAAPA